jgi:His Kinase A (phospho-acceptor) domain
LRFDDRLETALRQAEDSEFGVAAKWQQLVDILAQSPQNFETEYVAAGLRKVREFSPLVSAKKRELCVRSLAGGIQSLPLILLLAGDIPAVAAAAISSARLTDTEWVAIIPSMPTRARGFLRNRKDLGPDAQRALAIWSSADFILPVSPATIVEPVHADNGVQIRDIVERIERLRSERETREAPFLPYAEEEFGDYPARIDEIRFETDENGTVSWIEGAPPGAVVGVDIAEPAYDDGPGPDAYGAAAFRQRMPLENARMRLCGADMIAGDWRINAAPFFDTFNGRFNGYRGIFRRPNIAESALIQPEVSANSDHIEQLVHELRTPLGAIIGFSEIIEQQLFGPVTEEYRNLARNILHDAERLLAGFDDLSMAAKIESGQLNLSAGVTDCDWLASRLAERLHALSDILQVTLNLVQAHPVRPYAVESDIAERIFSRLLSAVIIGCEAGEVLDGRFRTEPGPNAVNRFVLTLPHRLLAMDEAELFGSGPSSFDDANEAPLLGLGFSLRLVRSLARNVGGDLRFYNEALILNLPATGNGQIGFKDEERE